MQVKAGEILVSQDGQYYRVTEVEENSVSLMRVGGQTLFACRRAYVNQAFQLAASTPVLAEETLL